jgi:hypothetical protein
MNENNISSFTPDMTAQELCQNGRVHEKLQKRREVLQRNEPNEKNIYKDFTSFSFTKMSFPHHI